MMKRSQIYLPTAQWRRLSALSIQVREPVSELIRQAIDKTYGEGTGLDFGDALRQASGLWKNRKDIPTTREHLRTLRHGSRLCRLLGKGRA